MTSVGAEYGIDLQAYLDFGFSKGTIVLPEPRKSRKHFAAKMSAAERRKALSIGSP